MRERVLTLRMGLVTARVGCYKASLPSCFVSFTHTCLPFHFSTMLWCSQYESPCQKLPPCLLSSQPPKLSKIIFFCLKKKPLSLRHSVIAAENRLRQYPSKISKAYVSASHLPIPGFSPHTLKTLTLCETTNSIP